MRSVVEAVRAATTEPGLYGVACSGGIDSIALADAAIEVLGVERVVVVTIDHGLVDGSERVAAAVVQWATERGAEAEVRRVTVAPRASIEASARDARYGALEDVVADRGLVAMLLGHTTRDQAETVLMRIVRGTGPAGLAGMPARRGPFVRPLLELPRAATEAHVRERRLPSWNDPMNDDSELTRVRVRDQILPLVRSENPAIDEALVRLSASAREWLEVIDGLAAPFAHFPIACPELAKQPPAVRKRAMAIALEHAGATYDAVHLEQLDALVRAPRHGEVAIDLPGIRLVRSYDTLAPPQPSAPRRFAAPSGPYEIRTWQPGDRMRPARLQGRSRKLSDLYIDARVPREVRRHAQVMVRTTDSTIVWAEHVGLAHGESPDLTPLPV